MCGCPRYSHKCTSRREPSSRCPCTLTGKLSLTFKHSSVNKSTTLMSFYSALNARRHFKSSASTLPSGNASSRPTTSRFLLTRRCTRLLSALSVIICLVFFFLPRRIDPVLLLENIEHPSPPLYEEYSDFERHLPQHNLSLPFPEGRDAKFLWTPNHVHGSGWGNVMQELLMNALLAHTTRRAFVFDNFVWDRDAANYSMYNGKFIPARIPLSAFVSGPVIGAPFASGDPAPRAVSQEYFKRVCPQTTIIDSMEVNEHLRLDDRVSALEIFQQWVQKLNSIEDPCVEIKLDSPQLFEIWLFGSRRILSMWPLLSKSPILTEFSWSPLILQAAAANADLLVQTPSWWQFLYSYVKPSVRFPIPTTLHDVGPILPAMQMDPIPELLALHIRRGDFAGHCHHLATWSSDFNGFNQFAALPDKWTVPSDVSPGDVTEAKTNMYLKSCFPSVEQIVEKVKNVLADRRRIHGSTNQLKRVYVMTNGDAEWLQQLKEALMQVKTWDAVITSRDLRLSWEAKPVAQSVDMLIGQRARVFIGNGFSSLTSNIVMFRMLMDLPPEDTRFW